MNRLGFAATALLLLCASAQPLHADDLVAEYFAGLNTFEAEFDQTVLDSNDELVQASEGRVWIRRPGRFRWDYRTPYRQLIVADGERLWTYDEDLEQATVEPVDEALSSTPAMLLSGFRPLEEVVRWADAGRREGLRWYRLDPKENDAAVEEVNIGFQDRRLAVIEVRDGFGNHTRIQFSDIERDQPIDDDRFRLQLPPGTDVIGDAP
ncbi:MAG: outer membrane lipoprotein chaperone LolA [Gammaproteobacteria bacterium]|jgi:outer membrane lipoprotein carrier protein